MKRSIFPFALWLCFAALLFACSVDDQDEPVEPQPAIVNTWRFTESKTFFDTAQDIRTIYQRYFNELDEPLTDEQLDSIERAFLVPSLDLSQVGRVFEFQPDGTITSDGRLQGTWRISGTRGLKEAILIRNSDSTSLTQLKIDRVTDTDLELVVQQNDILDPIDGPLGFRPGPDELLFGYRYFFTAM